MYRLKQLLWERSDGTSLDELLPEDVAEHAIRWIDTSCMSVDSLTKKMKPDVVLNTMMKSRISLRPTAQSQLVKLKKQKNRAKRKEEEGQGREKSNPQNT